MTERTDFEARLAARLVAHAAAADRPFDALRIARTAIAEGSGHRSIFERLAPTLPAFQVDRRVTLVLTVLALIVALLWIAAVIGSRQPDPNDLVRRSQAVHQAPPPFTMVTTVYDVPGDNSTFHGCMSVWFAEETAPVMRIRYSYDGGGRLRQECYYEGSVEGYPAELDPAFIVQAPDGSGAYWSGREWQAIPEHPGSRPDAAPPGLVEWLNWINVGGFTAGEQGDAVSCGAWSLGPVEPVAGRPARIVSCGDARYWIDEKSLFIVRREEAGVVISEALELTVGVAPPPALFAVAPPTDVRQRLQPGQVPVAWTLPLVFGGAFTSADLRGRPSVVLARTDGCDAVPCLGLSDFVAVLWARADTVNGAVYASWPESGQLSEPAAIASAVGFTDDELSAAAAAGIPVVVDDGSVTPAWDLFHGVELFDADGRHVETSEPLTAASLAAVVDALIAGEPIPLRPPGDGVFVIGEPVPPLEAPEPDGGTYTLALGARAAILAVGWIADPDSDLPHLVTELADVCGEANDVHCVVMTFGSGRGGSNPFEGVTQVLEEQAAAGHRIDRLAIVGLPTGDGLWSSLYEPFSGHSGSRRALVIVDAGGRVEAVFGEDGIPRGAELEAALAGSEG